MGTWTKSTPPTWAKNAVATKSGWTDPDTGELLVAAKGLLDSAPKAPKKEEPKKEEPKVEEVAEEPKVEEAEEKKPAKRTSKKKASKKEESSED